MSVPSVQREVSLEETASDGELKMTFTEKSLTDFWVHVQPEHPELADSALNCFQPPTTVKMDLPTLVLEIKAAKPDQRLTDVSEEAAPFFPLI